MKKDFKDPKIEEAINIIRKTKEEILRLDSAIAEASAKQKIIKENLKNSFNIAPKDITKKLKELEDEYNKVSNEVDKNVKILAGDLEKLLEE